MAIRPLRGARYAKDASPTLIEIIMTRLHGMDFGEVHRFYTEFLRNPATTDTDIALLGCNDRYFLLTGILNRPDAIHPWLYERCREVEARPDGYLDLWARAHYKSTIGTFAGSIQEALDDPDKVTISIFSNTKHISQPFLAQIKEEFEGNDYLRRLYADVIWENPRRDAPSWSVNGGLVLRRKTNPKECTFEAHGLIDGMPTGRHFSHHYYDDIINEKNVGNPEQIKKATERFELADNLGPTHGMAKKRIYGTRYSFADTYGVLIERGVLTPRLHPATLDGTLNGKLVLLDAKTWEEKKKTQRSTVAAQMLQNPLAGEENMFLADWLRPYWVRPAMMNVYIMADPSLGIHKTSDRTAIAVIGVDANFNKFLLDGVCHRMKLSDRWAFLKQFFVKWSSAYGVQSCSVGYERYGQQADLEYFEERMREEKVQFSIAELNWTNNRQGESKAHRVGRLEPDFRDGSVLLPAKVWHSELEYPQDIQAKLMNGSLAVPKHARLNPGTNRYGASIASWSVNDDGHIAYAPLIGVHDHEKKVIRDNELWRLIQPLRRKDEDNNIYDLTRVFFEEYLFFPFAPRDDLIDAVSRIYDMKPIKAAPLETIEPISYPDD